MGRFQFLNSQKGRQIRQKFGDQLALKKMNGIHHQSDWAQ